MGVTKNIASAAVFVLAGTGVAFAGTANAATASANIVKPAGSIGESCGPKADANKLVRTRDAVHTTYGSARITLRLGYKTSTSKTPYYWAKITGAKKGNLVWLGWGDSPTNRVPSRWRLCVAKVHSGSDTHTLAVNYIYNSDMLRWFRACGHHAGKTKCTSWH